MRANQDKIVADVQNVSAICCALDLLNNRISIRDLTDAEGDKLQEVIAGLRDMQATITDRLPWE